MENTSSNVAKWEFERIENLINSGDIEKLSVPKIEKLVFTILPRNPNYSTNVLPKIEKMAIQLNREIKKISISKKSVRDDIYSSIVIFNSILGKNQVVSDLILSIEKDKIDGINKKFLLDRVYKYFEKGKKLTQKNRIWSKMVRAYKRGEISALNTSKNKKVNKMISKEVKKSLFRTFLDFLGF